MSESVSTKPSKEYSRNYEAIFGKRPEVAPTRRRYFVRHAGKTIEFTERPPTPRMASIWPKPSYSFGVHPRQVAEATRAMAEAGVPTEFDPKTGDAIFRDRHHRKRAVEAMGMYDLDGGYSDPQQHKERFPQEDLSHEYDDV